MNKLYKVYKMDIFQLFLKDCPPNTQSLVLNRDLLRIRMPSFRKYLEILATNTDARLFEMKHLMRIILYTIEDIKISTDFVYLEINNIVQNFIDLANIIAYAQIESEFDIARSKLDNIDSILQSNKKIKL